MPPTRLLFRAAHQGFKRSRAIHCRKARNVSAALSLITAAIVHWNTVYLERAVQNLRAQGVYIPDDLLPHVAPLGWEHIARTGHYVWAGTESASNFRPLNAVRPTFMPIAAQRAVWTSRAATPYMVARLQCMRACLRLSGAPAAEAFWRALPGRVCHVPMRCAECGGQQPSAKFARPS